MQKQICQKGINIYVTYDEQPLSTSVNVVTIKEGGKQTPKSSLNSWWILFIRKFSIWSDPVFLCDLVLSEISLFCFGLALCMY